MRNKRQVEGKRLKLEGKRIPTALQPSIFQLNPCSRRELIMIDFNSVVEERIEKISQVLASKAQEYATDKSRFHNFEVAGRVLDTTPEKALLGMMLKHFVSVMDLIDWADGSAQKLSNELIDEKIGDNINYLILLEGMLKERIQTAP